MVDGFDMRSYVAKLCGKKPSERVVNYINARITHGTWLNRRSWARRCCSPVQPNHAHPI